MTTLATVRQDLAASIQQAGYRAYEAPLATVVPPAVVIVPDSPYLLANTLASGAPGIGGTSGMGDGTQPGSDGQSGTRNWQ